MSEILLKKKAPNQSLDAFVSVLDDLIGCNRWEEHESSNYPDGRYFMTTVLGVEIEAMSADDAEFTAYDFCLWVKPEANPLISQDVLTGLLECMARRFAVRGYEVARPLSSHSGKGAVIYRLDPTRGTMPWEQVVIEQILGDIKS